MTRAQSKTNGFTIIEVMIVLAIAGLIMLIVFLAVPALQRTSRNTQRKEDVASILNAVSEYSTNNGGSQPPAASFTVAGGTLTISGGATTASSTAKLGYYTTAAISTTAPGTLGAAADTVTIYEGTKCQSATSAIAGGARQIVALYGVETGSGTYAWQCQES